MTGCQLVGALGVSPRAMFVPEGTGTQRLGVARPALFVLLRAGAQTESSSEACDPSFKAAAGTTAAGRVTRPTAGTEITMAAATNSGSYPTRSTRAHGDRGGLTDDQDHVRAR